jgi:hypothetical protein
MLPVVTVLLVRQSQFGSGCDRSISLGGNEAVTLPLDCIACLFDLPPGAPALAAEIVIRKAKIAAMDETPDARHQNFEKTLEPIPMPTYKRIAER